MRRIGKIVFLLCFCASPLLAQEQNPGSFEWFWFLYDKEVKTGHYSFAVRPFYLRSVNENQRFDAFLMPVAWWRYRTENKDQVKGLFGFYNSIEYHQPGGKPENDIGIFPFLFYGSGDSPNENYLLFWPIGGNMKGKIGYENLTAAVFPGILLFYFFPPASLLSWKTLTWTILSFVPVYSSWSRSDYDAFGIFWPIFMRGKSELRDDIRIMPFYSHKKKKGWYERYSYLMLINYSTDYYENDVRRTFFFFPFFGRKWSESGRISSWTVLWPFFSWGYDKKNNSYQYNLPWPLVQIEDTQYPRTKKRIFFPFYGRYEYAKSETFFVTPLFFKLSNKGELYDSIYYTNALIVWWHKRDYHTDQNPNGRYWRYFKVWPLFSIEYNEKGKYVFNTLSLMPFRDEEGYERLYGPLWSLVEYSRFPEGEKRFGLILRTYYQRWGIDFFQSKVPILFSYSSIMNRTTKFSILLSMFGYSHKSNGRYFNFLWLPIRIGDADPAIVTVLDKHESINAKERWEAEVSIAMREAVSGKDKELQKFYVSGSVY